MFIGPFLIWILVGLASFGLWFGFTEKSFSDIDFKMIMVGIVFLMLGPINIFFAFFRGLGCIGRNM